MSDNVAQFVPPVVDQEAGDKQKKVWEIPREDGSMTFILTRPITGHGPNGPQQISEITLREPNSGDCFVIPAIARMLSHGTGQQQYSEMKMDYAAVGQWIGRLSKLDGGVLGQMRPHDSLRMAGWIQAQINAGPDEAESKKD